MNISIIGGTGPQGRGLALRFAKKGFNVNVGSRDKSNALKVCNALNEILGPGNGEITGHSNLEAAKAIADFIIIAVPWNASVKFPTIYPVSPICIQKSIGEATTSKSPCILTVVDEEDDVLVVEVVAPVNSFLFALLKTVEEG